MSEQEEIVSIQEKIKEAKIVSIQKKIREARRNMAVADLLVLLGVIIAITGFAVSDPLIYHNIYGISLIICGILIVCGGLFARIPFSRNYNRLMKEYETLTIAIDLS